MVGMASSYLSVSCGKLYCQSSLYGWNGFLIFVSVLSEAVLSVFLVWLEWLLNICQCLVGSCTVSLPCMVGMAS